jgi:hypothetical protein
LGPIIRWVLKGSIGVVKRSEMDSVISGDGLHLVDSLLRDESSSVGERLEPTFKRESHSFE